MTFTMLKERVLGLVGGSLIAVLQFQNVFANHNDVYDALESESRELNYRVQSSSLRYQVQRDVQSFYYNVSQLANCMDRMSHGDTDYSSEERNGPIMRPLDHTGGYQCAEEKERTQRYFRIVDRYLYDTTYDYPQIYDQYIRVKRVIRNIF